jgi:hypothetical protein
MTSLSFWPPRHRGLQQEDQRWSGQCRGHPGQRRDRPHPSRLRRGRAFVYGLSQEHQELREIKNTELNYASVVDNYLKVNDWRVKEKQHRHLFSRRFDSFQLRRRHRQLLAKPDL